MELSPQQRRRNARGASDDARPLRTKRRLAAAVGSVLGAGAEVSVASVSAAAGVGREYVLHPLHLARRPARFCDRLTVRRHRSARPREANGGRTRQARNHPHRTPLSCSRPFSTIRRSSCSRRARPQQSECGPHLVAAMKASLRQTILVERPEASEAFLEITSTYIASGVIAVVVDAIERPDGIDRDELVAALPTRFLGDRRSSEGVRSGGRMRGSRTSAAPARAVAAHAADSQNAADSQHAADSQNRPRGAESDACDFRVFPRIPRRHTPVFPPRCAERPRVWTRIGRVAHTRCNCETEESRGVAQLG